MPRHVRRVALPLLLCAASTAGAQRAAGVGGDAYVLPGGAVRVTFAPSFENRDERFRADGSREPIGAMVSGEYDATRLGVLAAGEQALRSLTGTSDARLSLGAVRVSADQRITTLPLGLEVGLARWLQFGVLVPFVRTRSNVVANADSARYTATAGLNPAITGTAARETNSQLVAQMLAAARAREAGAGLGDGACATSGAPACTAVNQARAAAGALATLYGTGLDEGLGSLAGIAGSAAVPLAGTTAAFAVDARIDAVRDALGPDGAVITIDAPAHAQAPIANADLRTFVTDQRVGLGLDDFRLVERTHLGDVEAAIKIKVLDFIGPIGSEPRAPLGIRAAITGVVRAPTGQGEEAGNPLDVGSGDGQTDIEVHGAIDVTFGRSLWISGVARGVQQLEDEQFVRAIVSADEGPLAPASATTRVRRDLGDAFELELTPRWMPNSYFSIAGMYRYRHKYADEYETLENLPVAAPRGVEALGAGTEFAEHRAGFGVTWSTMGASRRGKRALPLDVSYLRLQTVRARGGFVPLAATDQLRIRVWWGATR